MPKLIEGDIVRQIERASHQLLKPSLEIKLAAASDLANLQQRFCAPEKVGAIEGLPSRLIVKTLIRYLGHANFGLRRESALALYYIAQRHHGATLFSASSIEIFRLRSKDAVLKDDMVWLLAALAESSARKHFSRVTVNTLADHLREEYYETRLMSASALNSLSAGRQGLFSTQVVDALACILVDPEHADIPDLKDKSTEALRYLAMPIGTAAMFGEMSIKALRLVARSDTESDRTRKNCAKAIRLLRCNGVIAEEFPENQEERPSATSMRAEVFDSLRTQIKFDQR